MLKKSASLSMISVTVFFLLISSCTSLINPYLELLGYDEAALKKQMYYVKDYSGQKGIKSGEKDVMKYLTGQPHPMALKVPPDMLAAAKDKPVKNLEPLVAYLVKDTDNDFLKVKILHDFIIYNVKYDYTAFNSNKIPDQSYASVFSRGTGVCAGYSALFKTLCEMADIRCQVIYGYGRGVNYNPADDNEKIYEQHAWNSVLIDGGWYFVETTWDSCNIGYGDPYSDVWLFPSPGIMSYSHFPNIEKWQLLDKPLKRKEFEDAARLEPVLERIFTFSPDKISKINKIDGELLIEFPPVNRNYILSGIITTIDKNGKDKNKKFRELYIEYGDKKTVVRGIPAEKGLNLMRIFYYEKDENYDPQKGIKSKFAGEVCFDNKKISNRSLPNLDNFSPIHGFSLIEPLYGPLPAGEKTVIHFFAPGLDKVYIYENRNFVPCAPVNGSGEFIINCIVDSVSLQDDKSFNIYRRIGENRFIRLLSFKVNDHSSKKKN